MKVPHSFLQIHLNSHFQEAVVHDLYKQEYHQMYHDDFGPNVLGLAECESRKVEDINFELTLLHYLFPFPINNYWNFFSEDLECSALILKRVFHAKLELSIMDKKGHRYDRRANKIYMPE